MIKDVEVGDQVIFKSEGRLYKGTIKGFRDKKVEIDDKSIERIEI